MTGDFIPDDAANMDDLFEQSVDQDEQDRVARALLPSEGSYVTTPPFTVTPKHFEASGKKPARTIFNAYGEAVHTLTGKVARFRFPFSLDVQQIEDRQAPGEYVYDRASKNYIALAKAYKVTYGHEATKAGDLVEYLIKYPVNLRYAVFDGNDGPMGAIVNIRAVRPTEQS